MFYRYNIEIGLSILEKLNKLLQEPERIRAPDSTISKSLKIRVIGMKCIQTLLNNFADSGRVGAILFSLTAVELSRRYLSIVPLEAEQSPV